MAAHQPRRRPLPKGETLITPGAKGFRGQVERRSAAPLVYLHQLPGWVVPLAFIAVLVVGLAVKGWVGAAGLSLVAAFLGWFSYLSWPVLELPSRLLRGAVIIAVIALAVSQAIR